MRVRDGIVWGWATTLMTRGDELYRVTYDHGPACDVRWDDGRQTMQCRMPVGHAGDHLPCTLGLIAETGLRVLRDNEARYE
jgi:hypothetical protein